MKFTCRKKHYDLAMLASKDQPASTSCIVAQALMDAYRTKNVSCAQNAIRVAKHFTKSTEKIDPTINTLIYLFDTGKTEQLLEMLPAKVEFPFSRKEVLA